MGLFSRLSGKGNKGGDALCFIFGTDRHFCRRNLESQGSHIQDNTNRLAYFSSPGSNGVLSQVRNGTERRLGPVSVAFEPITELFDFSTLDWVPDRNKLDKPRGNDTQDFFEDDEILDNAWAEGFSRAEQDQHDTEMRNRLTTILLLAVLGAVAMFLLVAASTGQLSGLISGFGKFFGGG